jgi:hypothetical protein
MAFFSGSSCPDGGMSDVDSIAEPVVLDTDAQEPSNERKDDLFSHDSEMNSSWSGSGSDTSICASDVSTMDCSCSDNGSDLATCRSEVISSVPCPPKIPFVFTTLPPELQSMVLEEAMLEHKNSQPFG